MVRHTPILYKRSTQLASGRNEEKKPEENNLLSRILPHLKAFFFGYL